MRKYKIGLLFFVVLSLGLWLMCFWLLDSAGGAKERTIFGWAAGFAALMASFHTVLYLKFGQRKANQAAWFRQHGAPLQAEVIKISRSGHDSEWRIKAQHVDAHGNVVKYKSGLLNGNPARKYRVGDPITVYVDPANPERYWMDSGIDAENL